MFVPVAKLGGRMLGLNPKQVGDQDDCPYCCFYHKLVWLLINVYFFQLYKLYFETAFDVFSMAEIMDPSSRFAKAEGFWGVKGRILQ